MRSNFHRKLRISPVSPQPFVFFLEMSQKVWKTPKKCEKLPKSVTYFHWKPLLWHLHFSEDLSMFVFSTSQYLVVTLSSFARYPLNNHFHIVVIIPVFFKPPWYAFFGVFPNTERIILSYLILSFLYFLMVKISHSHLIISSIIIFSHQYDNW